MSVYRKYMESFYDYEKIAELRESLGISKQQMAEALSVSLMTIYRVETGTCSIELLAKIAIILDVPLATLVRTAQQIAKNFSPVVNIGC
jgi:transcriptional regulator with XRE-family HTH domain